MGITFKPYVAFGIGSSIRQLTYVFDNYRQLHIKGSISSIVETIPLEGAYAKRIKTGNFLSNVAAQVVDIGDVMIITSSGAEKLCRNIDGVQGFMQAVEGKHPDVQPPLETVELENFVICIPQMPGALEDGIWSLSPGSIGRQFKSAGDFIKVDEAFASHGPHIVSPVSGKVTFTGIHITANCEWPDNMRWPSPRLGRKDEFWHTKIKIQPVKGSVPADYIARSYKHVGNLIELSPNWATRKRLESAGVDLNEFRNTLRHEFNKLINAERRTQPVNGPTLSNE